jgi:hypothetical protein
MEPLTHPSWRVLVQINKKKEAVDDMTFDELKEKQRALRSEFPETMGLRVHRSISWIGRSQASTDDNDARFLFLWIAFNAAYAHDCGPGEIPVGERTSHLELFEKLTALDHQARIQNGLWTRFDGPISLIMDNKYLFNPFWKHHNGVDGFENWEERFASAARGFKANLQRRSTSKVLSFLFDRLYVLRNQLVHGGSTWDSAVNRNQVRDGADILGFLMPVFIDIMMDNPDEDWGRPYYPVVD